MTLININGKEHEVESDLSILEAVRGEGYEIPTLCYHPDLSISGGCRLCIVEDVDSGQLITSCSTGVSEGLDIKTASEKVERARKVLLICF